MESVDSAAARRTYLRLIEPVKGRIIGNVAIAALSSACEFVPYLAIARVAQLSITEGVPPSDVLAMWVLVAVAGAAAGRMLFSMATGRCHYADADFRVHVRTVLIEHLGKIPLGWFNDNSSAQVKQAATDDVLNLHQSVGHAPVDVTAALLSPLIPLVYLFTVDVRFALLLVAYFVVVIGVAWPFMMRDFGPLNKRFNEAMVEVSSAAVEMVEGIAVIKTFGSRSRAGARYRAATEELAKACYVWTKRNGNAFSWVSALFSPGAMLVVLLAATLAFVANGVLPLERCVPFLVLGVGVLAGLVNLFRSIRMLQMSLQAADHLASVLNVAPLAEPERPRPAAEGPVRMEFEGVAFAYGENLPFVLQDVDVALEPGTVTALVGDSGSGKTTLARLIPRFWDPVSGSVRMNGTELPQMASGEVLSRVAVVFQDSMLLRASIADNIRLGRPGATDEQVQAAARQAQIHDRVMELPQGYDTVLGSEGSDLSGGEAQRVAIARAIVQDAPILVLDEATAHADPENETAIQKALNALAKGRTTVVIAHRLDTIVHADQILVLVGGKVVERGVHEELLAADGHYAALWRSQQVDALEKALLVEGAAMRGAAAGPQEADGEAEPNGADSRESEER